MVFAVVCIVYSGRDLKEVKKIKAMVKRKVNSGLMLMLNIPMAYHDLQNCW